MENARNRKMLQTPDEGFTKAATGNGDAQIITQHADYVEIVLFTYEESSIFIYYFTYLSPDIAMLLL